MNFYESRQLSTAVRRWWAEPLLRQRVAATERIRFLHSWAITQEFVRPGPLGAKHPLLSLSGPDLIAAWGPDVYFVRVWRSLEDSVDGLRRRGWFPGIEVPLQKRLWIALEEFERLHQPVVTLDWDRVKSDSAWAARELASALGLKPTDQQFHAAAALVRTSQSQSCAA
jgi:hypothetical protein